VRRAKKGLSKHISIHLTVDPKLTYMCFMFCIYPADGLENLKSESFLRTKSFDKFIYMDTAHTLMKVEQYVDWKKVYLSLIPVFRQRYLSHIELLELPGVQKIEREDTLLVQFMMDLQCQLEVHRMLETDIRTASQDHPVDDLFTQASKDTVWESRTVSAWAVWTWRIFSRYQ
jgi:hypothetical protein